MAGAYELCSESRARRARVSPSEVYTSGKLQLHALLVVSILDIVYD